MLESKLVKGEPSPVLIDWSLEFTEEEDTQKPRDAGFTLGASRVAHCSRQWALHQDIDAAHIGSRDPTRGAPCVCYATVYTSHR